MGEQEPQDTFPKVPLEISSSLPQRTKLDSDQRSGQIPAAWNWLGQGRWYSIRRLGEAQAPEVEGLKVIGMEEPNK